MCNLSFSFFLQEKNYAKSMTTSHVRSK